jgi:S-adenosylmethionine:tRNA ribosyltransferase-isomerase
MSDILSISDYDYELPPERIAQQALEPRDSSKLLYYRSGALIDHVFTELADILPSGSTLFFNDAKVIPARIIAKNSNGASIEVFLLQPYLQDYYTAVNATESSIWTCLIGNKKKWKHGEVLKASTGNADIDMHLEHDQVVRFNWTGGMAFIDLIQTLGVMPLPPYIRHAADEHDQTRYQTVYSKVPGSVAAPTAGLHFTEAVLSGLGKRQIRTEYLTLHVSAGTFLPVKSENALEHPMHKEIFCVRVEALEAMLHADKAIAVGTTSCRVLESLYWCGVNLLQGKEEPFHINQFVYKEKSSRQFTPVEAIKALIAYCSEYTLKEIYGETSIMITPGYRMMMVRGLITNFHQPKSTLLLLISAFIGEDWKKVYEHALNQGYRFLSYGDSSFLLP